MFDFFKPKASQAKPVSQRRQLLETLAEASRRGDKKHQLLIALAIIGDGVMHIQEGYQLLNDIIEDDEMGGLLGNAELYVPGDVSNDIKTLIEKINSLWEPINTAADSSLRLLKVISSRGLM